VLGDLEPVVFIGFASKDSCSSACMSIADKSVL